MQYESSVFIEGHEEWHEPILGKKEPDFGFSPLEFFSTLVCSFIIW